MSNFYKENLQLLINQNEIDQKIIAAAAEISIKYKGKDLLILAIMNGALYFAADLTRKLSVVHRLETIKAASYGAHFSAQQLHVAPIIPEWVENKYVLILDDVFDTGATIRKIIDTCSALGAVDCDYLTLVRKKSSPNASEKALFTVDDLFLVGYGMDLAYHHRALPGIYAYSQGSV